MKRSTIFILAGIVLVSGALGWWLGRSRRAEPTSDGPAPSDTAPAADEPAPAAPPLPDSAESLAAVARDDDPAGELRLEGLVLGEGDQPVPNATVALDSRPPRTTTSGDDGSFVFDELPSRSYHLVARVGNLAGGPVTHQLTATSDPAVVRVREGAALEIEVVARTSGAPIARAAVGIDGPIDDHATADARGVAAFRGLVPDVYAVYAEAPGYARAMRFVALPAQTTTALRQRIELDAGAPVSGRVVDPSGAPIAGARVVASGAGTLFLDVEPERDGVETDADGRFRIAALASGSYRFTAFHDEHPPAASAATDHDGVSERSDLVIVMDEGGQLAGRVVDARGAAVPWATVRVGGDPQRGFQPDAPPRREVLADQSGAFRLRGLPRERLTVSATSDLATSPLTDVDLQATPSRDDLLLALAIEGIIAGIVVDGEGEPVAEAQVSALPDVWQGAPIAELIHRGPRFATTDGGGRFSLRGLPAGGYRLRPSRLAQRLSAMMPSREARAEVGDTDVRLVLARPGAITGTIALSSGGAPAAASVSVAGAAGAPARADGGFALDELVPGSYDLTVRGPEFADHVEKGIEVLAGAATDLGTITVERGRALTGRVLDRAGRPVGGAKVVAGRQLVGDGKSIAAELGAQFDEQLGVRRTTSQADGTFRLAGIGDGELAVVADHEDLGRSAAAAVPPGSDDTKLELRLAPLGRVTGLVTLNGEPANGAVVVIASPATTKYQLTVPAGSDGRFSAERIAEGPYKLTAAIGKGMSAKLASTQIRVAGGDITELTIDVKTGDVSLAVTVTPTPGDTIDMSQVFLFARPVAVRTVKQLTTLFNSDDGGSGDMKYAMGGKPATFEDMVPGTYSACVIPITGDVSDPVFAERLQRHTDELAVYCSPVEIAKTPAEQQHTVTVPGMKPLPE